MPTDKWIKKVICIEKALLSHKKIESFVGKRMDLWNIMLSKINQKLNIAWFFLYEKLKA